ncbi:MAG: mannose-6-phosphate isomerase, class I [Actinobacteria bacterium]|nr:mannose-6-phosphate isomerase, class I [Actinomycetota bacterium]
MILIEGVARHYPWGDPTAIPSILGKPADGRPWAEWWLGTHPTGPATLSDGTPLKATAGELPYLLKLLAAARPLSLQTHPDAQQAATGFEREELAGLGVDDARRIFRDPYAKPELLCALTSFDALCGFRPLADTEALLRDLGLTKLATKLRSAGLQAVVTELYRGLVDHREVSAACRRHHSPAAQLVNSLSDTYPDDPSVAVTLLLNRVQLRPGQALFLGPGNLHAYLRGVGVEVMGASDNVVRGGLTDKVIDVDQLLEILRFEPLPQPVLSAAEDHAGKWRYPSPAAPFELWRFEISGAMSHTATGRELLVCTEGDCAVLCHGDAAYLAPGETVAFDGQGTVFRVAEQ